MTRNDAEMLKTALVPHDEDYEIPCISPHNLEIVIDQLLLEGEMKNDDSK